MRIIALVILILTVAVSVYAADTRGLSVVAKDSITSQTGEVKLYNKSYAVIIGIDRYRNLTADRQLKNAVRDAKGIEETLRKQYRFDRIFTLHDQEATRDRIMRLLTSELPKTIGKEDSLFVFWAGHGNQEKTDDGDLGYLIPHDGNSDGIYGNITMSQLKDDISRAIPAKHVFYAFDACYSGLLTSRSVDKKTTRDLAYLRDITKERVRQVLTAGSKNQEALDGGPRGHSVFTGRLIEALEARDDYITANEIQALLKEKVYQDARARGHEQTPGYGTLYGTGDYVFIPIEQKMQDGSAELEKMAKERQALEKHIAELNKSRDADQQRRAKEEQDKLNALKELEKTKQEQLTREKEEADKLRRSQVAFAAKQKQQQEEIAQKRREEEQRLNELKKIASTNSAATTGGSLDAAVAEIKRLSAEIETLEAKFRAEQAEASKRISGRYDTAIADVRKQREAEADTPIVKGKYEKEAVFRERQKNRFASFDSRIAELEQQKRDELAQSGRALHQTLNERTAGLRSSMQQISAREYSVDIASISLELGDYDAEKEQFHVILTGKGVAAGKVDVKGKIAISNDKAERFEGLWKKGIVRPDVKMRAGDGKVTRIAFANTSVKSDSDSYLMIYDNGDFITIAEKMRREAEAARRKAEQERKREEMRRKMGGFDMEMVEVPGGCFQMGDTFGDGLRHEIPVHEVCLTDFSIGKYEVTQGQWKKIMRNNPSSFSSCGENCPVENVSWSDVQQFIRKLNDRTGINFRLPTEAEWEYAARSGGKEEKFSGGDNVDAVAWYNGISGSKTHPVGQKQANGLGIYDMSGNVLEWVSDWFGEKYYSESPRNNPEGPSTGSDRVIRGGSWDYDPWGVRAANRSRYGPRHGSAYLGFRLVLPIVQ